MKRYLVAALAVIVLVMMGCATVPVLKKGTEIVVENITFYDKMNVIGIGQGKEPKFEFIGVRNDKLAQKTTEAFREKFYQRLQEKGVEIVAMPAATTVRVDMVYVTMPELGGVGEFRSLQIQMLVFRGAAEIPVFKKLMTISAMVPVKKAVILAEKSEIWARERHARALANRLADSLVMYFSGKE